MVYSRRVFVLLGAVAILGTVFQFISYVAPGWVIFVYTNRMSYTFFHEDLKANYTYEWGMWFYHVCGPLRFKECQTRTYHEEYTKFINDEKRSKDEKMKWRFGQMYERMILEQVWIVVAFICSCLSCVTSCFCAFSANKCRFLSFWTVILTSVSGSLLLPLISVHIHQERWMASDPENSYSHLFPYSLLLCGMGLVIRSACALIHSVNIFKTSAESQFDFNQFKDTVNIVPVSTTKV